MSRNNILTEIRHGIINKINRIDEEYEHITITSKKISIEQLFEETGPKDEEGYVLTEIFSAVQGVTIGGNGSTEIYTNVEDDVNPEGELIYRSIMGKNIDANRINWTDEYLIFPYIVEDDEFKPAFYSDELNNDVLNFDINLDQQEVGRDRSYKLMHREARGYVDYTDVAEYLMEHYDSLYYRSFEGKHILEYGKSWYEYHRPRTPEIISHPKIVARRLMREPSFAIDEVGYLPRDSVVCLIPKTEFNNLLQELREILGESINEIQGFRYVLSYLNSNWFFQVLDRKRAKKKGDYPRIGERMLESVVIPSPSSLELEEVKERLSLDN